MVLAPGELFLVQGLVSALDHTTLWHGCHFPGPAQQVPQPAELLCPVVTGSVTFSGSTTGSAVAWALLLLDALAASWLSDCNHFCVLLRHREFPPCSSQVSRASVGADSGRSYFFRTSHCPHLSCHPFHLHVSPRNCVGLCV